MSLMITHHDMQVASEALTQLQLGDFEIKLNHRQLLDAMMALAGVPPSKTRAICSAIDKLDKQPWAAVRAEMVGAEGARTSGMIACRDAVESMEIEFKKGEMHCICRKML